MRRALYDGGAEKIEIDGRLYELRLPFGLVLRYMDLCKEPGALSISDIYEIALSWFVPGYKFPGAGKAGELVSRIVREYINPPRQQLCTEKKRPQTVDFNFDSGYIYAAFLQAYGIDLYECAMTLPWHKFISLFDALPENTAISRIMHIRGQDIPKPEKYNMDEIQRLTELKAIYAIPGAERGSGSSWDSLFEIMKAEAESNG